MSCATRSIRPAKNSSADGDRQSMIFTEHVPLKLDWIGRERHDGDREDYEGQGDKDPAW